jgi:hypothetical protein
MSHRGPATSASLSAANAVTRSSRHVTGNTRAPRAQVTETQVVKDKTSTIAIVFTCPMSARSPDSPHSNRTS